jgi:hypothetical protein
LLCLAGALLLAGHPAVRASVIYLYDFPGDPGSGLAVDQTNLQPSGATFSDFTRTNVTATAGGNVFNSSNWNQGVAIDTAEYVGFSITSAAGFVLNLTSLTFDARRSATGPPNAEVALFLNGSSTAYATLDFVPTAILGPVTFDFTDLTDADNVTSATFHFYGWTALGSGGQLEFGNVSTNGTISNLPEGPVAWPIFVLLGCVFIENLRRWRRQTPV